MGVYPTDRPTPAARLAIVVCANPLPRPPAASRILIVRLGAVGDVVRTLPAASALRRAWPEAHLAWLVEPPSASVVRAQPWLDEVIVFPRPRLRDALRRAHLRALARELSSLRAVLRARRFDLVLDFHSIAKSGLLACATGSRLRVGYAPPYGREGAWLFATHRARLAPRRASRFERNLALVRCLGLEPLPLPRPLALDPAAVRRIADALGGGPAPVVLHPGTSDATAHKRYPADRFAAVARALAEDPGVPSLVTAGPARDDRAAAEAVVAASGGVARPAPATADLGELAALLSLARLYVGGDTGPLHVASLVGTPVVQILGPTDPLENAPWEGTPSRTVRVPVACSPCRRGCAAATCMRVVPPEAVVAAARDLLSGVAPGVGGW
jgi:ADP-heptose:LPS heptosyltransferase